MLRVVFVAVFALAVTAASSMTWAGGHCDACGCACACRKVCKVICETKEVKKTTYSCECEDFCVHGPSKRCSSDCGCGHRSACRDRAWIPTAAYVATRKKPVKHTQTILKPVYKLVVQDLCPRCAKCAP